MARGDSERTGSGAGLHGRAGGKGRLTPEIERELEAIADHSGCELVHAEFRGGTLRLFIDREDGGIDLSDCETVSKQVSALLDVMDFGTGRYTLEVSSPGLDRQLYRPRDYERFAGHLARVTFRHPEDGRKETVVGRLAEFRPGDDGGSIRIEPERGEPVEVDLRDVETARLEIEL